MTAVRRTMLVLGAVLSSCAAPDAPDAPATPDVADIELRPRRAINLFVGDSVRLTVDATDASGRWVATPTISWRTGAGPVDLSASSGIARATAPGDGWIVAEYGALRDSVWVRVRQASGVYRITLVYAADVPQAYREAFASAARRWEQAIDGELPAVSLNSAGGDCPTPQGEPASPAFSHTERGTIIYVGLSGRFPPGTYTEAVGGPCLQRPLPDATTILGIISLNRDKPIENIAPDRLRYLTVHEMGHVLGLVGVVQGAQPDWFDLASGEYTGSMALEGWRRAIGITPSHIFSRSGAHWDPMPIADVMNASGLSGEISLVSIGALLDLGYPAVWRGAGPY